MSYQVQWFECSQTFSCLRTKLLVRRVWARITGFRTLEQHDMPAIVALRHRPSIKTGYLGEKKYSMFWNNYCNLSPCVCACVDVCVCVCVRALAWVVWVWIQWHAYSNSVKHLDRIDDGTERREKIKFEKLMSGNKRGGGHRARSSITKSTDFYYFYCYLFIFLLSSAWPFSAPRTCCRSTRRLFAARRPSS